MPRYRVQSIVKQEQWSSNFGPMLSFDLGCLNLDSGQPEIIQINSKPDRPYSVGAEFHADWTGKEFNGVKKMKRTQPPQGNGTQSSGQPVSSPAEAPTGFMLGGGTPKPAAMPYADAALLLKRLLDDFGPAASEYVFRAVLRGEVENPVKPKTIVHYMGNDLETAGIEQADFDTVMELSEQLARETDMKNVRALLIATCGVQTRKDLNAAKAKLFIETLKTNLAVLEAAKPPPEDFDTPF